MTKARDLANFISTGVGTGILSDGAISTTEITDVTVSADELNRLSGATSNIQDQLDNISVTTGSLTKSFVSDEEATITLSQAVSPAPVVSVTKEVPQIGLSSKGNWDVDSTGSNYDIYDYATNVSLDTVTVGDFSTYSQSNTVGSSYSISGFSQVMNLQFMKNGQEMYALNLNGNPLRRYTLSTPYDQGSATQTSSTNYETVVGQSGGHYSFLFNVSPTATSGANKIYVSKNGGKIYGVDLSTEFEPSSGTVNSEVYDLLSDGPNTIFDMAWNDDGTKLYIVSDSLYIYQYSVTTGYDLSSGMSYDGSVLMSGGISTNAGGMGWAENGSSLIITSYGNDVIAKYSFSTPYDITSTKTYVRNFSISGLETVPRDIHVLPDLTRIYLTGTSNYIRQLEPSSTLTKLEKSTGTWSSDELNKNIKVTGGGSLWVTTTDGILTEETAPSSYPIAAGDWEMVNVEVDATNGLSAANYIQGWGLDGVSGHTDVDTISVNTHLLWNGDGTRLYANGSQNQYYWEASTAYDFSSLGARTAFTWDIPATHSYNGGGAAFNGDGTAIYLGNYNQYTFNKWTLSTPYDLTTGQTYSNANNLSGHSGFNEYQAMDMQFVNNGNILLVGGLYDSGDLNIISLNTAYDPFDTSGTSVTHLSTGGDIYGLEASADGYKLIIMKSDESLELWECSTAFDYANATLSTTTSAGVFDNNAWTILANDNGTQLASANYGKLSYTEIGSATVSTNQYAIATTNSGGQIDTQYWTDINSMAADETLNGGSAYYAVSMDNHTTWNVAKGTDGVRPIVRNNSGTWQYNDAEGSRNYAYDNSTKLSTVDFVTLAGASWTTSLGDFDCIEFKPDGTKVYIIDGGGGPSPRISQFDLSTPWDMSSGTFVHTKTVTGNPTTSLIWKPDGTRFYYGETFSFDGIVEYVCSTPWEVSSASHSYTESAINNDPSIQFIDNGSSLTTFDESFVMKKYSLTTAYQLNTINTNATQSVGLPGISDSINNIANHFWADSGNTLHVFYTHSGYGTKHREYSLSTAYDLSSTLTLVATNENNALDDDVNDPIQFDGMTIKPDGTRMYAINDFSEVSEFSTTGTQYTTNTNWVNATTNAEIPAIAEALDASVYNKMDSTQLAAIADANHFALGDTLDLATALYTTSTSSIPTSDGVTINYDAEVKNEGAILGTDYDFDFPESNKVRITANSALNLKVRVV